MTASCELEMECKPDCPSQQLVILLGPISLESLNTAASHKLITPEVGCNLELPLRQCTQFTVPAGVTTAEHFL